MSNKYTHIKQSSPGEYEDRVWTKTRLQSAYRFHKGRVNDRRISNEEGTIGTLITVERIYGTSANPNYPFGAVLGVTFTGNTGKITKAHRAASVG